MRLTISRLTGLGVNSIYEDISFQQECKKSYPADDDSNFYPGRRIGWHYTDTISIAIRQEL